MELLWTQSEGWNGVPGSTDGKEHESVGQTDPGSNLPLIGDLEHIT